MSAWRAWRRRPCPTASTPCSAASRTTSSTSAPTSPRPRSPAASGCASSPPRSTRLEEEIDALNADLAPLTSFVLPGGTPAAAALHLCRTVARRAERLAVALAGREAVNQQATRYINRLSDFFFVAARLANDRGAGDVLWVPGENR